LFLVILNIDRHFFHVFFDMQLIITNLLLFIKLRGKNHVILMSYNVQYRWISILFNQIYYIEIVKCRVYRRINYFWSTAVVAYYNHWYVLIKSFFRSRIFGKRFGWLRRQITSLNTNYTFTEKNRPDKSAYDGSPAGEGQNIGVLGCALRVHFG